jgi:hypothetical protein
MHHGPQLRHSAAFARRARRLQARAGHDLSASSLCRAATAKLDRPRSRFQQTSICVSPAIRRVAAASGRVTALWPLWKRRFALGFAQRYKCDVNKAAPRLARAFLLLEAVGRRELSGDFT